MDTIQIGDKVIDETTGFAGTVTAYAQYLSGEDRAQVEAGVEGKPIAWWFDVGRLTKQVGPDA